MANVTPTDHDHRGLLIPDAGVLGVAMSATTQAGPKAGGAVLASGSGSMALATTGTVDRAFSEVKVIGTEAGVAGTATVRHKYTSNADYCSWDPPIAAAGFEFIDRTTTADYYGRIHAVRMPDTGRAMVVVSSTSGLDTVQVWLQDEWGIWSSVTVSATGNSTAACLVPIPRGTGWRYLCFYTYRQSSTSTQIRMSYSDDSGATWTVGSTSCLSTALNQASSAYPRLRAVYLNGAISLIVWRNLTSDYLAQYVSTDGGGTLDLVETFSTSLRGYPDMCVYGSTIYIGFLYYLSTRTDGKISPYVCKLTSASQPISSVLGAAVAVQPDEVAYQTEWGTQAASLFTAGEFAMVVDDDGLTWCYGIDFDGTREGAIRVSADLSETWSDPFISSHNPVGVCWWPGGDTSTYPSHLCAIPERGRVLMLHSSVSNPLNDNAILMATYLGGWSTRGMNEDPTYSGLRRYLGVSGWDHCYLPLDKPGDIAGGYTETIAGTATSSIVNRGLQLDQGAAGDAVSYTMAPAMSGTDTYGIVAEFHVDVASGDWVHDVRISDGAQAFSVRALVSATSIVVRDLYAGVDLFTFTTTAGANGCAVRISLDTTSYGGNNGRVTVSYRQDGPYTGGAVNFGPRPDRVWAASTTQTGLTRNATGTTAVTWGTAGGTANGRAYYRLVAWSDGDYTAGNNEASGSYPTRGRIVPSSVRPLHLVEGIRIHSTGGYLYSGDTYTINTAYEYPVTNLDPSRKPSPRATFRSTSSGQCDVTWTVDMGWWPGDLLGVMILGANWRTGSLYYGSGLTKIMDIDLGVTGLTFVRGRDAIVPATGGANLGFFAHEGALTGATVDLGGGDLRKVRHNHAGAWLASGGAGAYPSTRILLSEYDAGDAASGTMILRMPSGLFISDQFTSTDLITLRIDAQTNAESYHETGTVLIGKVHLLRQYGRGRVVAFSPSVELTTTDGGASFARKKGPARRKVEFDWSDSVNMTTVTGSVTSAPDGYTIGYGGADQIAAPYATPYTVGGLISLIDGPKLPIGYCPAIPVQASAITTAAPIRIIDPTAFLYGRAMVEEFRTDAQLGHENRSEEVRAGLISIVEEK